MIEPAKSAPLVAPPEHAIGHATTPDARLALRPGLQNDEGDDLEDGEEDGVSIDGDGGEGGDKRSNSFENRNSAFLVRVGCGDAGAGWLG